MKTKRMDLQVVVELADTNNTVATLLKEELAATPSITFPDLWRKLILTHDGTGVLSWLCRLVNAGYDTSPDSVYGRLCSLAAARGLIDTESFLVARLEERLVFCDDPWGADFETRMIAEGADLNLEVWSEFRGGDWSAEQHAARIRYLMSPQGAHHLADPIVIDNMCDRGRIFPEPIILDGNHRFQAHRALKRERIEVVYGGRMDVMGYLSGWSDEYPTD